jgi:hypothetical protein
MKFFTVFLLVSLCLTSNCQKLTEMDLIGCCWFIPHSATINIHFYSNHTFVFNDYNSKKNIDEKLIGKFLLVGQELYLIYNDRPKQKAKFFIRKEDENAVIRISSGTKKVADYVFLKGECDL